MNEDIPSERPICLEVSPEGKDITSDFACQIRIASRQHYRSSYCALFLHICFSSPRHEVSPYRSVDQRATCPRAHVSVHRPVHTQFVSPAKHVPFHMPIQNHVTRPHD